MAAVSEAGPANAAQLSGLVCLQLGRIRALTQETAELRSADQALFANVYELAVRLGWGDAPALDERSVESVRRGALAAVGSLAEALTHARPSDEVSFLDLDW